MLTYSFHISQFISFLEKTPSLAQFIPGIYNKIIIKIIGYFWGVTFIDTKKVTKSHILAVNTLVWIDVLERKLANEYKIRLKRRRPISSKDITPCKRRTQMRIDTPDK